MDGRELRSIRKALKLTQAKLGDEIGMSLTAIGYMERGYDGSRKPYLIEKRTALAVRYLKLRADIV